MNVEHVHIIKHILTGNDQTAERNRARLAAAGVLAVNVIASPGAGKTSLISKTIECLKDQARIGVIEGDIAGNIDTEQVLRVGASDAVQINTGGNCHLEANMVQSALDSLNLGRLDVIFVENVGNLVCPTHWDLGEQKRICVASTAEGHDKPLKYPDIFVSSDAVILNKIDLIDLAGFDRQFFYASLRALNRTAPVFEISCRTSEGLAAWTEWLLVARNAVRPATLASMDNPVQ